MTDRVGRAAAEAARGGAPRISLWHLVLGIIGAVLAGALLITGIGRLVGFADLDQALDGAEFGWLAVCFVGQLAVFAGYAGAFRAAVAGDGGVSVRIVPSIAVVLASFAATQLFAFAGAAGLAVVYWALRRVGMERDAAAVRLIGLNTAVYLVFGVVGWSAALWSLLRVDAPLAMTVPWLVVVPLVLAAATWFTAPARVRRWTARTPTLRGRLMATGVGAAAWVRHMVGTPSGRPLFAWAACYWAGDIASLWAGLHAFGARPHLGVLALVYATGYLVQSLPIPLIATGGVDAATVFLLQSVGVPLEVALLGVVAHRVFAFWLPVGPGVALALLLPRTGRALLRPVGTAGGAVPTGHSIES